MKNKKQKVSQSIKNKNSHGVIASTQAGIYKKGSGKIIIGG